MIELGRFRLQTVVAYSKDNPMKTIKVTGTIDGRHQLAAEVPETVPPGPVDVLTVLAGTDEDDAGQNWEAGIAREWADDLGDPRQDIYALMDGQPPSS